MSARTKLNSLFATGCVTLAALVGLATGSWMLFWATLALALAGSVYSGEIRPRPTPRPPESGRRHVR